MDIAPSLENATKGSKVILVIGWFLHVTGAAWIGLALFSGFMAFVFDSFSGWLSSPWTWLIFVVYALFIVCGMGLKKRKKWSLHILIALLVYHFIPLPLHAIPDIGIIAVAFTQIWSIPIALITVYCWSKHSLFT